MALYKAAATGENEIFILNIVFFYNLRVSLKEVENFKEIGWKIIQILDG